MSNLKTDEDDDFITSASPETEPDEADFAFDAKEKKKKRSSIISRIILIICACVFVFAAVRLVSILLEYKKGNDIYDNIEGNVLDDTPVNITIGEDNQDVTIPFVYNHQALLDINPDGLGFLYVPSVDIKLPIAQTTDNDFYLTHTFDKTYNRNGCLSLIIELKMVLMPAMLLYMDITWVLVLCLVLLPDIRILVSTRRKVMMFFIYIQKM